MCHVLGITASPHNGTWNNVKGMLRSQDSHNHQHIITGVVVMCIVILISIIAVVSIFISQHTDCNWHGWRNRGYSYSLQDESSMHTYM